MTITWADAQIPFTQQQAVDAELAALEAAGSNINGFPPEAPQRALVEAEAMAMVFESEIIASLAKTASPSTVIDAGDDWVDAELGWFDIERIPATRAVWTLRCYTDTSTLTVDGSNANQIQAQSEAGVIFLCSQQSAVTFNAANIYIAVLEFTARDAGSGGNVGAGTIRTLISGPSVLHIVLPPEDEQIETSTARDQETSAALIRRALGRWGVIGPSADSAIGSAGWTRTSLDYLIPLFGNVAPASVTRWSVDDSNPLGPGTVEVALANASGPADAATIAAVATGLNGLSVKPVGSGAITVVAAVTRAVTINATILVDGSNSSVGTQAHAAIIALGNAFPLGPATLALDLVIATLMGRPVNGAKIPTGSTSSSLVSSTALAGFASVLNITSLSISADVEVMASQVLVITSAITVTP